VEGGTVVAYVRGLCRKLESTLGGQDNSGDVWNEQGRYNRCAGLLNWVSALLQKWAVCYLQTIVHT
jgi:hypothetical protein